MPRTANGLAGSMSAPIGLSDAQLARIVTAAEPLNSRKISSNPWFRLNSARNVPLEPLKNREVTPDAATRTEVGSRDFCIDASVHAFPGDWQGIGARLGRFSAGNCSPDFRRTSPHARNPLAPLALWRHSRGRF